MNGTGKVQYSIGDAAGNADSLLVKATPYRDVIGLDIDHVNVRTEDVTYFGIDHLTVDAGAANDEVDVRATVASTPVDLLGGSGNDLFQVSALAGTTIPLGTLLTIQGQLTIDAGSGSGNRIDVNNVGGNATPLIVMQDDGNGYMSIRNIAPAPIRYKATGGAFFEFLRRLTPLGYEADAGITVRGSNLQSDNFWVLNTIETGTTMTQGWGGNDMFNVASGDLDALPGLLIVRVAGKTIVSLFTTRGMLDRLRAYSTSLTSVNGPYAPSTQPRRTFAGVTFDGTAGPWNFTGR